MIELSRYKKQFGNDVVLDIGELKLEKKIYWLKGINGSGKSTFLHSLAGLNHFDGTVFIEGCDIKKHKMQHRGLVGYAPAEVIYPEFLTGMDLINFYIQAKGGTKDAALELCEGMLLLGALAKKTGTYSSGMRKKLALVLAFVGAPQWILLDEPLITLDTASVHMIVSVIHQHAQEGTGFIITSHQDAEFGTHLPLEVLSIHNRQIIFG